MLAVSERSRDTSSSSVVPRAVGRVCEHGRPGRRQREDGIAGVAPSAKLRRHLDIVEEQGAHGDPLEGLSHVGQQVAGDIEDMLVVVGGVGGVGVGDVERRPSERDAPVGVEAVKGRVRDAFPGDPV